MSIEQVWKVLEHRERQRLLWSRLSGRASAPENVFYSVTNSLKHRRFNRYADILAYDRTALVVEGEYLNANTVTDGRGGRWVASQVRGDRAQDSHTLMRPRPRRWKPCHTSSRRCIGRIRLSSCS